MKGDKYICRKKKEYGKFFKCIKTTEKQESAPIEIITEPRPTSILKERKCMSIQAK